MKTQNPITRCLTAFVLANTITGCASSIIEPDIDYGPINFNGADLLFGYKSSAFGMGDSKADCIVENPNDERDLKVFGLPFCNAVTMDDFEIEVQPEYTVNGHKMGGGNNYTLKPR